jgi:hypothetical protein
MNSPPTRKISQPIFVPTSPPGDSLRSSRTGQPTPFRIPQTRPTVEELDPPTPPSPAPKIVPRAPNLAQFVSNLEQELEEIDSDDEILKVQHPLAASGKLVTEEQFWAYMDSFDWQDRSVKIMSPNSVRARLRLDLTDIELKRFRQHLDHNVEVLSRRVTLDCDEKKYRDILSHIVARGSIFYANMYEDPEFAVYLLDDEYQSLYDCLS